MDLLGKMVIVHIAMLLYQRVRTLSQLFPSGFGMIMKKLGSIPYIYMRVYAYWLLEGYLVGGLEHFLFFHILGIIVPTD